MAEDWSADVKKYGPNADDGVIAGIVRHCGIALQKVDSSLVSFSDKTETDRVRESFLKKKLGLTDSDSDSDDAIAGVGQRMKADRTKNRVTVYYLLAEYFGKLVLFSGSRSTDLGATAGTGAAVLGAAGFTGAAAVGLGRRSSSDNYSRPDEPLVGASSGTRRYADEAVDDIAGGSMRWLPWLLLAAGVLALLWYLFLHHPAESPVYSPSSDMSVPANAPAAAPPTANLAPPVIPTGAGVTAETRNGKPAVIVYLTPARPM